MSGELVVLDVGSGLTKGGRASQSLPSVVVPTVAGAAPKKISVLKKKAAEEDSVMGGKPYLIGEDAIAAIGRINVDSPMEHGVVKNWGQMEHILRSVLDTLGADIAQDGVVLTQPSFNPLENSETFAQLMFETFDAKSFAFASQGPCALYASGRTTGIVLDSGEGITQCLPIYDSFIVNRAANRINIGGKDVGDHFTRILFERGYNFTGPADRFLVQKIKEELCYVSTDYAKELDGPEAEILESFGLPDGQSIEVGKERFRATEILFNPTIIHSEMPSFPTFVTTAVKGCGLDIRPHLLGNIVLTGGNTMFNGFADRIKEDVLKFFPGFGGVKVVEAPDRKYAVWAGASVLSTLSSFKESIIPKAAYEEHGPSIVHGFKRDVPEEEEEEDIPPPPPEE